MRTHATCVALPDPAGVEAWAGVLLRGPSGAGKSDLALRLIDAGARLVADDQVELSRLGDAAVARATDAIAGLIEVRGLGVVRLDALDQAPVRLAVDPAEPSLQPRLPERAWVDLAGAETPLVEISYGAPAACARVRIALRAVRLGLFADAAAGLDGGTNPTSKSPQE